MDASAQVLLVCSPGGHLLQLHALREAWEPLPHAWVTLDKSDSRSLLRDERVHFAAGPTVRSIPNLLRNLALAWRVLREERPQVLLTTGAGIAVPFAWIAKLRGVRVIYVESLSRIDRPSLSCRLIAPVADEIYVQWPELLGALPHARYAGAIFSTP
jgi:beta-1,4-N-acetylglucosaminyltransferase